jgi:hypothetical protein
LFHFRAVAIASKQAIHILQMQCECALGLQTYRTSTAKRTETIPIPISTPGPKSQPRPATPTPIAATRTPPSPLPCLRHFWQRIALRRSIKGPRCQSTLVANECLPLLVPANRRWDKGYFVIECWDVGIRWPRGELGECDVRRWVKQVWGVVGRSVLLVPGLLGL